MRSATGAIAESVKKATVACDALPLDYGKCEVLMLVDAPGRDELWLDQVNFLEARAPV